MKITPRFVALILATAGLSRLAFGAAVTWDRIPAEDLATTAPVVESDYDPGVEVLLRETSVDESDREGRISVTRTHVRYKVFDERGVKALQKIDIRYDASESRITAIGARVIKPDGSVIGVERSAFFNRKVVRNRYLRYDVVTFSPPALEPGVIVEYKVTLQSDINYAGFYFMQDEFPTRVVRFRVRPPPVPRLRLLTLYHRCPQLGMKPDTDGYLGTSLERIPGVLDEPFSPPDEQIRSWMIYYYALENVTPDKFWMELGRDLHKEAEKYLKPNAAVKKAAAEITAGAASDMEKLERIETFCRTQIRNLSGDASGFSSEEIAKLKENKGPADTLANKYGWGSDIRLLYIALARAAGFDARLARCADRSRMAFDPRMVVGLMAPDRIAAVNVSGIWWFAQPNVPYVEPGSLHWTNEGETVLVSDPKEPVFAKTLSTPAERSLNQRTARLTLADDGTLEGDVEIVLTGHHAVYAKEDFDDETPGRREELVRENVQERLPTAEVSGITLDNITGPVGAVTLKYHLKVPGYAQVTGQRLFLQPSVFEVGAPATFTADARKNNVFFPYQLQELDRVEIQLPEGFELENAHAPEALPSNPTLVYEPKLSFRRTDRLLIYERNYTLKLRNVAAAQYEIVRETYDHIHRQDAHTVGLRRAESGEVAAGGN